MKFFLAVLCLAVVLSDSGSRPETREETAVAGGLAAGWSVLFLLVLFGRRLEDGSDIRHLSHKRIKEMVAVTFAEHGKLNAGMNEEDLHDLLKEARQDEENPLAKVDEEEGMKYLWSLDENNDGIVSFSEVVHIIDPPDHTCEMISEFVGQDDHIKDMLVHMLSTTGEDNSEDLAAAADLVSAFCDEKLEEGDPQAKQCKFYVTMYKESGYNVDVLGLFGDRKQRESTCGKIVNKVNTDIESGHVSGVFESEVKNEGGKVLHVVEKDCQKIVSKDLCISLGCHLKKSGECVGEDHGAVATVSEHLHRRLLQATATAVTTIAGGVGAYLAVLCRNFENPALPAPML